MMVEAADVLGRPRTWWYPPRTMGDVVGMAFLADQVCKLTSLSRHQLAYWVSTGFFASELSQRNPSTRLFTFRDVVGLRVIAILRNEHRVPLQELRKVGAWLKNFSQTPWASLRLYVSGSKVYFEDPATGRPVQVGDRAQAFLPAVDLQKVADDASARVQALRERRSEQRGQIERKRDVARNAPRLSGTRIPTAAIVSFFHAGHSVARILEEYPTLTAEDVAAAVQYEETRRSPSNKRLA